MTSTRMISADNAATRQTWLRRIVTWTSIALLSWAAPSLAQAPGADGAQQPIVIDGLNEHGQVQLMANKSAVVSTARPYKRVSIAQPEVADVNPVAPTSILITAKRPGATQLIVWDEQERPQVVDVLVTLDFAGLQNELNALFPGSEIEVKGLNGSIALRGRVPNLEVAEQAVQAAEPYAPRVLNFLEVAGGQQILLHVRFAEVSRTALTSLGVNFALADGTSSFANTLGQINPIFPGTGAGAGAGGAQGNINIPTDSLGPNVTQFGGGVIGSTAFEVFLSALRQNNLLRVLAEPNVIAMSGQEGEILAGGEYPVPVPQDQGEGVGIEYREFGVKLKFVPIALGDGRIRLKLSPEVSDLDFSTGVTVSGVRVPGLRKRTVTTTVELAEGQTFAVGGLLSHTVTASKDVTPLLGDLPIIGTLFRSVRYQRQETELVVLVTPHVVSGLNPDQVPPLPGEAWRHPTEGQLFWDADLGGPTTRPAATKPPPQFQGPNGFVPVE